MACTARVVAQIRLAVTQGKLPSDVDAGAVRSGVSILGATTRNLWIVSAYSIERLKTGDTVTDGNVVLEIFSTIGSDSGITIVTGHLSLSTVYCQSAETDDSSHDGQSSLHIYFLIASMIEQTLQ